MSCDLKWFHVYRLKLNTLFTKRVPLYSSDFFFSNPEVQRTSDPVTVTCQYLNPLQSPASYMCWVQSGSPSIFCIPLPYFSFSYYQKTIGSDFIWIYTNSVVVSQTESHSNYFSIAFIWTKVTQTGMEF